MTSLEDVGSRIPVVGAAMGWESDAEKNLQAQMQRMQQAYQNYRPVAAQARGNELSAQLQAWAPVSDWAAQMTGGQAFDPSQMQQAFKDLSNQAVQVGTPPPPPSFDKFRQQFGMQSNAGPRTDDPAPVSASFWRGPTRAQDQAGVLQRLGLR